MKKILFAGLFVTTVSLVGCNREPETVIVNQVPVTPPNNTVVVQPKPATPAPKVVVVPQKKTVVVKKETEKVVVVATPTSAPPVSPIPTATPIRPKPVAVKTPTPRPTSTPRPRPTLTAKTRISVAPSSKSRPLVVNAEIAATSTVPAPSSVPYADSIVFIKYKVKSVTEGKYDQPEILVAHWAMKAKKLQPAAKYQTGQTLRLQLEPFDSHPEVERIMRLDDTGAFELTPYWAVRAD